MTLRSFLVLGHWPSGSQATRACMHVCVCVCKEHKNVRIFYVLLLFLTLWLTAESALLHLSLLFLTEEESKLLWRAGLLRENHPSKEPRAQPSALLTRKRSSQEVCRSWIISTGAPSSVMVVRVSGMSSLSW